MLVSTRVCRRRIANILVIILGFGLMLLTTSAAKGKPVPATQPHAPPATPVSGNKAENGAKLVVRTVELQLDAKGKGSLRIDSRMNPDTTAKDDPPKGQAAKLSSLAGAEIARLDDGRFRIVHDFGFFKDLDDLVAPSACYQDSLALDPTRHALIFKPVAYPGGSATKVVELWYPRSVRLPVTVRLSLADLASDPFAIELRFQNAKLNAYLFSNDPQLPGAVSVSWFNFETRELKKLVTAEKLVNGDVQYSFDCPIAPDQQTPRIFLQRVYQEVAVNRLEVTAGIPAFIGVQCEDRKGQVIVTGVFEGPAAKAGVKPGDILTAVGDKPAADSNNATQVIRGVAPGDTVRLTIIRDGKTISIPVIAE